MNVRIRLWLLMVTLAKISPAQNLDQVTRYVNEYKFLAISEMQRSGVPASIILAQGIHESQAGNQ